MSLKNKLQHQSLIEEFLYQEIEMYFSSSKSAIKFWDQLVSNADCYVFGGFVVDFLKQSNEHRDIDIVILSLNQKTLDLINAYGGIKNSFGGYKLNIDGVAIDIWAIKDTWAIKKMNNLDFDLINQLPSTSFFNSTAIIYSVRAKKVIYHNKFIDFLYGNKLDILFQENPYPALCILKSYQYYKTGIQFNKKLSNYIYDRFNIYFHQLGDMQVKHYGSLKYSNEELVEFFKDISSNLNSVKKDKISYSFTNQLSLFEA
jgi:hypothetical protein